MVEFMIGASKDMISGTRHNNTMQSGIFLGTLRAGIPSLKIRISEF